jgi:hypothetical protein
MSYLEDDKNLNEIPKIKVIIRKRSLNMKEIEQNETDIIEIKDKKTLILKEPKITLDLSKTIENHTFTFDKVYDENSTNEKIYLETVRPMIKCAFFKKAKISIFCYGQTGSGKTYTMMGNLSKNNLNFTPGLYSFAAYDIFQIINYPQFENYYLTCSFYEIYCGKLYDLLNNRNILNIREDGKQNINIIGLTEKYIEDFNDLINLIDLGLKNRTIGTTKVNNNSSRSHGIIQINILDSYDNINGKISFIDLAGSERESDKEMNLNKQTRIDGAEINKSLLALKECIRALELDKKHLPFRGSKLTLVLRDSFIGNCKTLMIANISPSSNSADHTLNTLRYADRVKELKKSRTPKKNNNNRNTINFDTKEFIANLIGDNNNKVNNNNNNESSLPKIITVVAATNRPWDLDEAIRRRFEKRIYIPLPDEKGREELFKINLKGIKCSKDVNISKLVKMSDGYSGADIANVCREAAFMPMRIHWEKNKDISKLEDIVNKTGFQENLDADIKMKDFLQAMKNIKKSVGKEDLKEYDNWTKEFKSV